MSIVKTNQVFIWTKTPTVTLVDRSKTTEAKKLAQYLDQEGLIVGLHGASQTGKTVLCEALLRQRQPITLEGQKLKTASDMWDRLHDALDLRQSKVVTTATGTTESVGRSSSAKGGISLGPISVGAKAEAASEAAISKETEVAETGTSKSRFAIDEALAESKRPIILDDFHWIASDVQSDILHELKAIARRGTTIVLVTVQESALAPLHAMPEFQNRYELLAAPNWKPSSIALIGRKGFVALNVAVDDQVVQQLAAAARRNPLMMQKICWEYCIEQGITERCEPMARGRQDASFLDKIYKKIAESQYRFYSKTIESGPRAFAKAGKRLTFREVLFIVLSNIEHNVPISFKNLKARLIRFLPNEAFRDEAILRELKSVSDEFATYGLKAPFRYDEADNRCVILAPEFRMAIKFHLAPKYGFHRTSAPTSATQTPVRT